METSTTLCQYCAAIPFEKLANGRHVDTTRFSLGAPSRVEKSAEECTFCRLVMDFALSGLRYTHRLSWKSRPEVVLFWRTDRVHHPGGCAGFQLISSFDKFLTFISTPGKLPEHSFHHAHAVSGQVDIPRISKWIKSCNDNHKECRPPLSSTAAFQDIFPGLEVLRLIDVEENCLVERQAHVAYLALSYVWGSVANFRLTRINRSELMRPGTVAKFWNRFPYSIRDAIDLTRKLGVRYLWVDSICLIQNDSDDLKRGVNVMDQIYENAWLTVIAAHGHDANAGLPGLQPGTRQTKPSPQSEVRPGITLGQISSSSYLLEQTIYQTRAWTFQEHTLSRRVLYFFPDQVIFTCCENECREICNDDTRDQWASGRPMRSPLLASTLASWHTPARFYSRILTQYTAKSLTNSGDILWAFEGIMRRFSQMMGYRMMQGVPIGSLDFFIVFFGFGNRIRRPGFPSYSWAGWLGTKAIAYRDETKLNIWLIDRTWIIWYQRGPDGAVSPVWDPAANPLFLIDDPKFEGYRERCPFTSPIAGIDTSRTRPSAAVPAMRPVPSYPLLQFWTFVVFLKIEEVDVFYADGILVGKDGVHYGPVHLDGFEETTLFDSKSPLEFLVLSEADTDLDSLRRFAPVIGRPDIWNYYNVMLIEWNQGIAERRGMGQMLKEGVHQSFEPGPVWKEIILG
ncbi:heterokaryon incompatibility protein-domain-containing protein [Cladorrhinum samala]|uniref:Heterokaryon incompatibility protein-domain-containing protein n=1 Tax=Cladorrhinum samala TaxID=585594 RepID=A0AAV9HD58_9PEZI|nr:heterokaryon incompatibility protein-domain-containing protein [Cladorrhinum samala]